MQLTDQNYKNFVTPLYTERHKQVAVTSRLKLLLLMGKKLFHISGTQIVEYQC